ncbi:MAG: hypothetical protein V3U92_03390 [Cellulophaga sp.]
MFCAIIYNYPNFLDDLSIHYETIAAAGGIIAYYSAGSSIAFIIECTDSDKFHKKYKEVNPLEYEWTFIAGWKKFRHEYF